MDRKKLIQLIVIVAAFGGSFVVLYNGFFKQPSLPASAIPIAQSGTSAPAGGATDTQSLPYGTNFNKQSMDKILYNHSFRYGEIQYPVLNPSDVGVQPQALLAPAAQ